MVTETQFLLFSFSVWTFWLSLSDLIPIEFVCWILENNEQLIHVSFKPSVGPASSVHLVPENCQNDHLRSCILMQEVSWWLLPRPHKSNHKKQPPQGLYPHQVSDWLGTDSSADGLSFLHFILLLSVSWYTQFPTNSSKRDLCVCSFPG